MIHIELHFPPERSGHPLGADGGSIGCSGTCLSVHTGAASATVLEHLTSCCACCKVTAPLLTLVCALACLLHGKCRRLWRWWWVHSRDLYDQQPCHVWWQLSACQWHRENHHPMQQPNPLPPKRLRGKLGGGWSLQWRLRQRPRAAA